MTLARLKLDDLCPTDTLSFYSIRLSSLEIREESKPSQQKGGGGGGEGFHFFFFFFKVLALGEKIVRRYTIRRASVKP